MSLKSYSRIYWLGIKLMIIIPGDFRFSESVRLGIAVRSVHQTYHAQDKDRVVSDCLF